MAEWADKGFHDNQFELFLYPRAQHSCTFCGNNAIILKTVKRPSATEYSGHLWSFRGLLALIMPLNVPGRVAGLCPSFPGFDRLSFLSPTETAQAGLGDDLDEP
ncbi:hypothetical protein RRG08_005942 [Elysia crispata]|uniref:Uncharacterized protein n=1 Tax=Elysia crispata TaxID=231223 RepID=A0AAE0ZJM7_9GAST|nr:hypothetical protein RRG08_005942 [Elysia crispata]